MPTLIMFNSKNDYSFLHHTITYIITGGHLYECEGEVKTSTQTALSTLEVYGVYLMEQ